MNVGSMDLQNFIQEEMKRREMSERAFADFVGISHTTINRWASGKAKGKPDVEMLISLSKATGVRLATLIDIAYADVIEEVTPDVSTQLLAKRIEELPDHLRDAVITLIMGYNPKR